MDASDTENVRKGLSNSESRLLSSLSEKNKTVFGLGDITAELDCSYQYAKVLANNLAKKRWIVVLRRGTYLIVPLSAGVNPQYTEHEFVIASHIVSPYYIAYWSALNFHRFTEQTPMTVFVATTKRVKNREILNVRYSFVTLKKRKFFGFVPTAVGTHKVNVSNPEKTLADALDHPEYCGGMGEVAKSLWAAKERVSVDEIANCAKRMGNSAIIKRLGYLVETLEIPVDTKTLEKMRKAISQGMSVLDPTMPRKGTYTTRWNLLLNVSKESIEKWRQDFDIV
ncbi:MAG: transcriptional regulator [Thaumarchaeota archaeon]|nr:transcriptional regulator [Nitrososphaerota archaeon]